MAGSEGLFIGLGVTGGVALSVLVLVLVIVLIIVVVKMRKKAELERKMFGDTLSKEEKPLLHNDEGVVCPFSKVAFIYNPAAGKGQGAVVFKRIEPLIKKVFGKNLYKCVATEKVGGARSKAEAMANEGCNLVVACGGDGTVHEVLNGIVDKSTKKAKCAMAVLPIGTGDDFAKSCGMVNRKDTYLHDYPRMIRVISQGHTIKADFGYLESCPLDGDSSSKRSNFFMNEGSFGISGDIMQTVNGMTSHPLGKDFTFTFQTLAKQLTYQNKVVVYQLDDGKESEVLSQLFAAMNGRYFGGGMEPSPRAKISDKMFNLFVLKDVGFRDALTFVPKLYEGKPEEIIPSLHLKCKKLTARPKDSSQKLYIECDGELCGTLPATFEIVSDSLDLVVDPGNCLDVVDSQSSADVYSSTDNLLNE